jgi:hypothetical protein
MNRQESIASCPLTWPEGYKRTQYRKDSRFARDLTIALAADNLENELNLLGAKNPILSTNIPQKLAGGPRSGFNPGDPGVAVYFKRKDKNVVLACDKYRRVQDNIHAIVRTINSLRQIDRDGVSDFLERAFTGFTAIAENAGPSNGAWWQILELSENCTYEEAEASWKQLSKKHHPDLGDDSGYIYLINDAWERAKKEFSLKGS